MCLDFRLLFVVFLGDAVLKTSGRLVVSITKGQCIPSLSMIWPVSILLLYFFHTFKHYFNLSIFEQLYWSLAGNDIIIMIFFLSPEFCLALMTSTLLLCCLLDYPLISSSWISGAWLFISLIDVWTCWFLGMFVVIFYLFYFLNYDDYCSGAYLVILGKTTY